MAEEIRSYTREELDALQPDLMFPARRAVELSMEKYDRLLATAHQGLADSERYHELRRLLYDNMDAVYQLRTVAPSRFDSRLDNLIAARSSDTLRRRGASDE